MALFRQVVAPLVVPRVTAALSLQVAALSAAPLVLAGLFLPVVALSVALSAPHVRAVLLSLEFAFLLQISFAQVVQVLPIVAARLPAQPPAIVNARVVAVVTISFL